MHPPPTGLIRVIFEAPPCPQIQSLIGSLPSIVLIRVCTALRSQPLGNLGDAFSLCRTGVHVGEASATATITILSLPAQISPRQRNAVLPCWRSLNASPAETTGQLAEDSSRSPTFGN
ncbi:hypothetical protein Mapa_013177 [Marchantia paleacea]|nr:hypothetical protein Mapa_013177 [Marchantia paleacea]